VQVPGTFLYAAPEPGARTGLHLSLNSRVSVAEPGPAFAGLDDGGFVPMRHLAEPDAFAPDFVAVAERFLGTPYVWGGRTRVGIDCSGLVQTALHAAGHDCPRDSDMQMAELGRAVPVPADLGGLQRGDLVFWRGHVGILADPATLLHATATFMAVVYEPLARAVDRIARNGSAITAIRRIDAKGAQGAGGGGGVWTRRSR
jgi:cell wall-associated NlpC family hydrolase